MQNLGGQTKSIMVFSEVAYRPFPSSPQPPFQIEAKCEVCYENQFSFILKLELIAITKISTSDSI